jgi:hypothetical protein
MNTTNLNTLLIAATVLAGTTTAFAAAPKGWIAAGSKPKDYNMSVDRTVAHGGEASASLKCVALKPGGFGTLMQTCKADAFRGKRVRMSGYVRSQNVTDWAGLWLRIDGARGEPLGFDNMQQRPIKGTGDWKKCEIVLDVPESAAEIAFGLLLTGPGQAWMDDLAFEVVGTDVPTTGSKTAPAAPSAPANLNFEE